MLDEFSDKFNGAASRTFVVEELHGKIRWRTAEIRTMPDDRTEIAAEAAAKAFHETCREKRQYTWEQSS